MLAFVEGKSYARERLSWPKPWIKLFRTIIVFAQTRFAVLPRPPTAGLEISASFYSVKITSAMDDAGPVLPLRCCLPDNSRLQKTLAATARQFSFLLAFRGGRESPPRTISAKNAPEQSVVRKERDASQPLLRQPSAGLPVSVRRKLQEAYFRDWKELPFPAWPVDFTVDTLHEKLLRLLMETSGIKKLPFIWFWPEGASSCLIMTHDVETSSGRDFTFQNKSGSHIILIPS